MNISSGASLEFFDSGVRSTSVPSERLYFRSAVTGDIDGGTLRFNLSNVYFNTTSDFKFRNNATLSLEGVETSAEFERLDFTDSQITLDRNTTLQVNEKLLLNNSDVTIDNGARLVGNGFIDTFGAVAVTGAGRGARITGSFLRVGDAVQTSQLTINNVPRTDMEFLFFTGAGSTLELFNVFNLTEQLYARGNSDIQLRSGALFNLSGAMNAQSSEINITVDNGAAFAVKRGGTFTHTANTTILNNGVFDIDGDFFANQAVMSGTGEINVLDYGRLFLPSAQSTLTVDNPLTMGSFINPLPGGELHTVINVDNGTPENGTIFYGSGDIDVTRAKSLNVTQAGTNTASEMDGKAFTVIQAQNASVTGTLTSAANMTVVEGGNIPALIDFTVIDLNTNGKPDLTLSAAKLPVNSLAVHPNLDSANHLSTAQLLINAANSDNASIMASLDTLTNAQLASHFDSIHAEPYSSYMTVSLEHSDSVMNTVMSHAAANGGFSSGVTEEVKDQQTGKRFWMDVSYADGKVDGSGDLGDFDYTLSSLTIGQDLVRSGDRALGAYFSIGTQKMNEHDSADQYFNGDTYHLGLYLNQANIGAWDLRGVLGYAFSDHESKRQVNLSSSSTIAEADFNSHSAYAGVKGTITGYENDWVSLSPELGLSYIYYSQESIQESGDPNLSLSIDSADTHAIVASVGLNARFASLSDTMSIYPLAFSRYEYDFYANKNNEHEIDAALVADPDFKQSFVGQNRGEHAIISGIGLGSDLTSALQINGGFDYAVSNHGSEWGAGFNLKYHW
ncbi:autotransporter outer membrane beta-barrel domain-containing protein [Vibrio breoganii]|nr:autotransporter outer membrane beta-barrel domain-containing protein [Vibrio breoganii]